MKKAIVHDFETYRTIFLPESGDFLRMEKSGYPEPKYAIMPELLDISITNFCEGPDGTLCPMCYKASDEKGIHMDVNDLRKILDQVKDNVLQIAYGGGNTNQHPDFIEILRMTKEEFGIIPNYTTNGAGLTDEIIAATKEYCGAVAVSWHHCLPVMTEALNRFIAAGCKTNIHFILDASSVKTAISILKGEIKLPEGLDAIIFLTFKPIGRAVNMDDKVLKQGNEDIVKLGKLIDSFEGNFVIGFDSCAVPMLLLTTDVPRNLIDTCEGARFSGYISEDLKFMPCSFMDLKYGIELKNEDGSFNSIKTIWNKSDLFTSFRHSLLNVGCDCKDKDACLGGCPLDDRVCYCNSDKRIKNNFYDLMEV